ncbi:phosphoethanolamine transferase EptA [Pantoea agglomerans]|uniref:phosphoethanolamine transferase EptA n=1 Tax=Pantoea TaxID=53335 RepID=UPI00026D27BC|nr:MULTISPECIES: phosphoethanolamine transferase EptA [Pantoea]MBD8117909.1 phosphoethanolamine transferase EptA [Pantoea agglomerans]MBD8159039.1 phosphoethanolamine transferase EptA [Pantoea agglomerans]MBD8230677.1 phosphoethanolamine transferase EptA [Pantoea agglomerans]MBD8251484.1 phosphoethanolamine transferase EptA [Pantoea agglomerans]MCX2905602.1 phosphoethanolamine transferase EptA [[Curtobacterium] plantarum]
MPRFTISQPVMHRVTFIILFSIYISVFLNLAFYRQAYSLIPLNELKNILFLFSMPLVAFSVINIVVTIASFLWLDRITIALFIFVSATAQYFIQHYGIILDRSMITNMVDTTPAESMALLTPKMIVVIFFTGIFMAVLAFWPAFKKSVPVWKGVLERALSLVISVVLIAVIAMLFYKDYASLFRNNHELVKSLSPSNFIAASLSYYNHRERANLPLVKIGEDAHQLPHMLNGPKKNLTILVVGETSRAANFSLGGYSRPTNPLLAEDDVVYFPDVSSCGTSTAVSVPCMFSNMPRKHYDDALASHQEGLLDIIQRAGLSVLWNENDAGCKGACDRVPNQDMTALNLPGMCIKGECYDEVLFHGLEEYIKQLQGNGLIVLHTIGSHGPTYNHRYPPAFRKFTPTCETKQIQECSQAQLINTYDNTILYADYIVDKAIELLKAHQEEFTTSLVYLSDHGESLGEKGVYLHGLPYAIAPEAQTRVPLLIWLSPDYQQRYAVDYKCLSQQATTQKYSQDNLFSTMLGITGVQTREYVSSDDIVATCRNKPGQK